MDEIYIRKILSGDVESYRYFIKTYQDMAFSVALSIVKQEHLAEDVVQDAFIKCYQSLSSFKGKSKFSTWFYRIVVHIAFNSIRYKKLTLIDFDLTDHDQAYDESILDEIIDNERREMINDALAILSPKESVALRLFYLEEQSMEEIQEIMGWTLANTKVILHRARKNMQLVLSQLMKKSEYHG
ncbi:sigma-70 family RNA polymerase sigma factor [Sphingobacterium sp. ML3W]|uniref:RNA polymerase sigma factor n=1 Tax=Sphingobacterium sp. ML3W TaxID=1538644 RepID=UPI00249B65ED|nr:sigma-70 family RNA polymerase sigma factor [Sphingobacterium sp. ML3W]WFA77587.1 sigma-70 family RNA polymerase sigma factor [Sphingobacterium sp. ML3W]